MTSAQRRIKCDLLDKVEDAKWQIKYKLRLEIQDVDIINALIYHHLEKLSADDVLKYRKEYLGKDE